MKSRNTSTTKKTLQKTLLYNKGQYYTKDKTLFNNINEFCIDKLEIILKENTIKKKWNKYFNETEYLKIWNYYLKEEYRKKFIYKKNLQKLIRYKPFQIQINKYNDLKIKGNKLNGMNFNEIIQETKKAGIHFFNVDNLKITSLDIKIDIKGNYKQITRLLINQYLKGYYKFNRNYLNSGTLYIRNKSGKTLMRIYDKRKELLEKEMIDIGIDLIRFEVALSGNYDFKTDVGTNNLKEILDMNLKEIFKARVKKLFNLKSINEIKNIDNLIKYVKDNNKKKFKEIFLNLFSRDYLIKNKTKFNIRKSYIKKYIPKYNIRKFIKNNKPDTIKKEILKYYTLEQIIKDFKDINFFIDYLEKKKIFRKKQKNYFRDKLIKNYNLLNKYVSDTDTEYNQILSVFQ
jgi:hypothetical protein